MDDDNKTNVVKLRQPRPKAAAGASIDEAITPKSLLNMTVLEQEAFLNQLRERRLKAAALLKEAKRVRHQADSVQAMMRLEKKQDAAQKQYDKATKALDKLEELLRDLRAMTLHYTDNDITKVEQ